MKPNKSQLKEETISTIMDFFKNIPITRLIEIKRVEQGNMGNDVWQKERTGHLEDGDYSPDKARKAHERLYIIRRENRLHQKDLANILGIHPTTYHKKEIGSSDFELREAKMLAKYFDVTLDDLFGD